MHRLNNYVFRYLILMVCLSGWQEALLSQSREVQLNEVRILGTRKSSYATGLHTLRIDSLLKTRYFGTDLAQVLKQETNLNITQYGGQGSLATIRMRGSAPSQTQINWNGIPVNSPTTGSVDLSLLSGGMADAIEIAYGASGSLFGNGTFGGSINLFNNPEWDNKLALNATAEAGSWGHYKTGLSMRTGSENWQYHFSGLFQSSSNRYPYLNTFKSGNPTEYRLNDDMNLLGFQQHLFFRLPGNWLIQYGAWWHNRAKQLPPAMSSAPSYSSYQNDRSLRQFIRATKSCRKSSLEMAAAFFTDSLQFGEINSANDSLIMHSDFRSSQTYVSVLHRWFISDRFTLENGADYDYQYAKTGAYGGKAGESRGALFSHLKYSVGELSADLSYRQVFYSMTGPKPLFSAGLNYQAAPGKISVKGQISNKFRFPTLNDRFWKPGGNPALLPETGMGYDLGVDWQVTKPARSSITLNSMLFIQNINNWIQWVPTGTWWSPKNVKKVHCQGLEIDINGKLNTGSAILTAKAMYSYTESLDESLPSSETRLSRQLAYVPFHLLRIQGGISYGMFNMTAGYKFTSRRFTTDDHDPWLELQPTHLVDVSAGYTINLKKVRILVTSTIANLLNAHYELIRAYPAPGRSFYLSVNYSFNNKNSSDDTK